jgi:hypothetical protein
MTIAVKDLPPTVRAYIIDLVNPVQPGCKYRGVRRNPKTGLYEAVVYLQKTVHIEIE